MDLYAGLITRNPVSTADFKAKIASIEHFGGRGGRNEVVGASSAEGRSAEVVTGWARIVGARDGCFHAAQLNRGINAPENANYAAPFTMGDLTIVSHSRLDNREELFVQLEIANESRSVLPDYAIILHAWMKWGAECVHKFRGDWSFVIYDENTGDMHMAVDYIAGYEVYYAVEKGQISFSNHLKAAVQLKSESAIVDEKFILNRLMIHRMEDPVTGLNDVFKVAPGHLITISKDLKITKKRYWFPDHLTKLATSSDDEIIAEFLQIYETAVRRRIQPGYKIGSHLSGGLDSGSVSWLASKVLKSEERPLLGLTGTELFDTSASLKGRGNEEQYAQITAAATGHIEQLSFKCEGVSIIDSIRHEITRSLNLSHGVGNIFWIHAISKFAKRRGLDTILVGQVGNASVTWAGKGGKNYIKKEILNLIDTIKLKVLVRDKTVFELDVYPFTFFLRIPKCC